MKTTTKLAGYLFAAGVMAMSPISAFAAEGSGTNGLSFYDYLSIHADKDTIIDFNQAPTTGNETIETPYGTKPLSDIGGLYMLQETKDDAKPMYFYRGNVEDNNVILNDMCWLIVRTTETGGTKLLYNGTPTNGQCLGDPDWTVQDTMNAYGSDEPTAWPSTNIGVSQFNASNNSPSDMYYMYGERYETTEKNFTNSTVFGNDVTYANGTYTLQNTVTGGTAAYNGHHYTCLTTDTTCSEVYYENYRYPASDTYGYFFTFTGGDTIETALAKMAENRHDSVAKTTLENWYAENMTGVTDYLEETIWYGDKTYATGALATKDANFSSNFDKYGYSYTTTTVDVFHHGASRESDSSLDSGLHNAVNFDHSDADSVYTVANGTLKYPVGLLTSSEMIMAGVSDSMNSVKGQYIDDNFAWWGVSPIAFVDDDANAGAFVGFIGDVNGVHANVALGLRPVVSLKSTLGANSGDGSKENPFTNITEESTEDEEKPAEGETTPVNPPTSDAIMKAALLGAIGALPILIARKELKKR